MALCQRERHFTLVLICITFHTNFLTMFQLKNKPLTLLSIIILTIFMLPSLYAEAYFHKDYSIELEQYLSLVDKENGLEDINVQDKIKNVFKLVPLYTNAIFTISVPDKVLDMMFEDIGYTIDKANLYGKSIYTYERVNPKWYKIEEPPKVTADIYVIHSDTNENRFVFLVEGDYKAKPTLTGRMLVEITYREINGFQYLNVHSYVVLTNKFLWKMARLFSAFPSFRKYINKTIDQNIRYSIRLGKITAAKIYIREF